jgi:type IV secretory pathway VirJ component
LVIPIRSALLAGALLILSGSASAVETVEYPALGSVTIYQPVGTPKMFVIFVSGDGGWNLGVVGMAQHLVEAGAFVAGVDINQMGRQVLASSEACSYAAGTFETFSHFVQQKYRMKRYATPILVGYSSGATVVYATLAQAPAGTFKGALSLGFCPDLEWSKPLCRGEGLAHDQGAKGGFVYRPAARLRDPWIALQGEQDQVCTPEQTRQFAAKVPGTQVVTLPKVRHGYSVEANWLPQFLSAFHKIADDPVEARTALPAGVSDLPLVELPATGAARDILAIMLSGDGGWAGLDKEVARELNARGVPVVGWDSLRCFWDARTPDRAARDLDRVIRHYAPAWHKSQVLLVGYSQGADTMPFMLNPLPDESRRLVKATALVAVSDEAFVEFHVSHWLGTPTGGLPTAPEIADGRLGPVACIYGRDETSSPCRKSHGAGFREVALSGGHHFDGNYAGVAQAILAALPE